MSDNEHIIKQVFDSHFQHLVLAAFRYVNSYDEAEDIVQDIYVKLWRNIDELKHEKNLKSYLFKAVKNSCINYHRHMEVVQKYADESKVTTSTTVEFQIETGANEDIMERVHRAVNQLPDHWREAFVLSKYDKLKYEEIAQELNISIKTVEKYISKSLHFLRDELKDLVLVVLLVIIFFEKL